MTEPKLKRSFYHSRIAYGINRTVHPTVSKLLLDIQTDEEATPNLKTKTFVQRKNLKSTALDRIIGQLKKDNNDQDILIMITPACKHVNLYKLHVIQRHSHDHLGMITITLAELSHLKASRAFQNYCIVFGSRYVSLLQTEKIQSLVNCLNKENGLVAKETALSQDASLKSHTSFAGDYLKNEDLKTITFQDSCMQTDPDETESGTFSLTDIYTLIETINCSLQPSKNDITRFFFVAEKLNFSLIVRPELLWKSSAIFDNDPENGGSVLVESYLPGSCYLGGISLLENDLLQALGLFPKLLLSVNVIEDVFAITPVPKKFVSLFKKVLGFLKLELLSDVVGEFLFDWYKYGTYL